MSYEERAREFAEWFDGQWDGTYANDGPLDWPGWQNKLAALLGEVDKQAEARGHQEGFGAGLRECPPGGYESGYESGHKAGQERADRVGFLAVREEITREALQSARKRIESLEFSRDATAMLQTENAERLARLEGKLRARTAELEEPRDG